MKRQAVLRLLSVALAGSMVLALFMSALFHVPAELKSNLQLIAILAGLSMALTLVSNVYGAIVIGLQKFEVANGIEVSVAVVKAALTVLVLWRGHGLVALGVIQAAGSVATGILFALASWKLYPQLRVRCIWADAANIRSIFSFGSYLFLLNASAYLVLYTDSLVIGAFLPVAMVTFFAIGGNLVASARSLVSGISTTMSPLASSLDASGKVQQIRSLGLAGPRYASMLMLPIAITFALRGKTFIGLWMGPEYASLSGQILQVLSLVLFFGAANQVATSTILGLNKHRPLVFVNIAEGVVNLLLSVALVHRLGVIGVALGTVIPNLATSLIFWPSYMRRVFEFSRWRYIASTWIRPLVAAIPFALASLVLDRMWHPSSLGLFFAQIALTLPAGFVAFWFVCFTGAERLRVIDRVFPPTIRVGGFARS
jgi:O-antigen/teichoic acid export membrane protein